MNKFKLLVELNVLKFILVNYLIKYKVLILYIKKGVFIMLVNYEYDQKFISTHTSYLIEQTNAKNLSI